MEKIIQHESFLILLPQDQGLQVLFLRPHSLKVPPAPALFYMMQCGSGGFLKGS